MPFLFNQSHAQVCNYKLNSNKKIEVTKAYGEELTVDIQYTTPNENDVQAETGIVPSLGVIAPLLPKVLNFASNRIKRKIKRNQEQFQKEYEFRQTFVYPSAESEIDEILLCRNVLEKGNEELSSGLMLKLKRVHGPGHIYAIDKISLPISKAKGNSEAPFLNFKVEMELVFFDEKNGKLVIQKSSLMEIPLVKIGSEEIDLSEKKIRTSRFTNYSKPVEIKIRVTEYNPSKAKYEDIENEVNEVIADVKGITDTLTLEVLNEILTNLKSNSVVIDDEPIHDVGF